MYQYTPPHPGVVTQEWSEEHQAVDIACVTGDPVVAAHDGMLNYQWSSRLGNVATIRNGDQKTLYAHLQVIGPRGWYNEGEVIGACGSTGSWSTGPHVHFESTQPYSFK